MAYGVKILAHSACEGIPDLATVEARFPRKVLAEVVTHRLCRDELGVEEIIHERTATEDLSKNSASSRAIPLARMIQAVFDDPYVPERFSGMGKGMQGDGWLEGRDHDLAAAAWLGARDAAVTQACMMITLDARLEAYIKLTGPAKEFFENSFFHNRAVDSGISKSAHKQEVNRLLEPWAWVTQVITADARGWNNFFALRCHKDAEPAFQKVARMIFLAKRKSIPRALKAGDWHVPFHAGDVHWWVCPPNSGMMPADAIPAPLRASAARCAWVSYENHDRESDQAAADRTFMRLCGSTPVHASPLEHQAMAFGEDVPFWLRSNLRGWLQLRKLVRGERSDAYEPGDEEIASWGLGE